MNTSEIRIALTKRFSPPRWVLFREVATVISNQFSMEPLRYADYVAMSMSKAQGTIPLEICGIEVKVSRSDYKNELKNPAKSSIKKYCDSWYLVCPKDMIDELELPDDSWGLIYVRDDLSTMRKRLSKKEPAVFSKDFMASVFHRYAVDSYNRHAIDDVLREYRELLQIPYRQPLLQ